MANTQLAYINELKSLSLLTATTGQLEIARIPVVDNPDWIIPRSLIIDVIPFTERIWNYLWQANETAKTIKTDKIDNSALLKRMVKQEIAVYHLFPKGMTPRYITVVESFTDVHRIALQVVGDIQYHQIRIADLKDADDPASHDHDKDQLPNHIPHSLSTGDSTVTAPTDDAQDSLITDNRNLAPQSVEQTFVFQPVIFQGELCVVPDLDKLSHYLVDLDS